MKIYMKCVVIFILIMTLSMLTSCQKRNDQSKRKNYSGNINILTDKDHKAQFEFAAREFEKQYKRVSINVKVGTYDYKNSSSLFKNNNIDMFTLKDEDLQYIIDKNKKDILNLTEDVSGYRGSIQSNEMHNCIIDGKVYAMPWDALPKLIIYRRDVFKNAAVNPQDIKTWKDYIEVGNKLYQEKGAYFTGNYKQENNLNLILANQLGSSYLTKDKKLDFKSEKWNRIFGTEKDIYKNSSVMNFYSKDELLSQAKDSRILAIVSTPYIAHDLMKLMPDAKDLWGVMEIPSFEPGGNVSVSFGGVNIVVNKNCEDKGVAEAFMKFALTDSKLQIDLLNNYGRLPVYKNAYYFKDINKYISYYNSSIWSLFIKSEQGSYNMEYTEKFPDIKDSINTILNESNIKNTDSKTLISNLEKINVEK